MPSDNTSDKIKIHESATKCTCNVLTGKKLVIQVYRDGLGEWVLLSGAGVAQWMDRTVPEGYWRRRFDEIGDADFLAALDDPRDQAAIRLGYDLWTEYGAALTQDVLLDRVRHSFNELAHITETPLQ